MSRDFPLPGGALGVRMRRLLDTLERPGSGGGESGWAPAVDIVETSEAVIIVAELAGVSRSSIKVMVDGPVVRLYGRREPTVEAGAAQYHRMEIETGDFVRSFRVTVPFAADQVSATTSEGLLRVVLPKLARR
ncbi:MAG: Hsp20/alpha crystallin family protein [Desulfarculaceae bacterium]|nr:Hsp20/alpha crystallin family protein [Desulfarculaceae bacterium]MCF8074228.1 Hsp20/alpha crystallin family protein [Desulfarculaceae bacterium]MCF8103013.1 Hsp20/alpha crystallin family protein [Desulfarculaceae bacterium]MCF8117144.1 Hsp20/alpha crystallin family protein [Desulfarculaceae bacterium]